MDAWDYFADDMMEEPCDCNVTGCTECDERYYENFDCGMMSNGQCLYAGSEDCDFECPIMRSKYARTEKEKKEL